MAERPWDEILEEQLAENLGLPQPTDLLIKKVGGGLTVDLDLDTNGNLQIIRGRKEVIQALYLRTIAQKGDWIFDVEYGLPWLEHPLMEAGWIAILGQIPPDFDYIKVTVLHEWSKDPRFVTAPRLDVDWADQSRRKVSIAGQITASLGGRIIPVGELKLTMPVP